ncbi:N-substituted formamide deformylase precursor [Canicola haemoglobinophilus]|uniref:N-substituted formamide deformylase n=1 Tax=Canicola haemoglobinophilus TaxID=733 RepID=A0AB38HDF0_9PAST|nr:N-substituted formamide deformylase precursor [Canicola haemoglobinophilus]STO69614.1 N-substituted formamide deformylase precursor [Canicola haemoglobinophilus]
MTTQVPDLIFYNGKITTLNRAQPVAQAVAIKDGKFLAVGSDAEVMPLATEKTRCIDLKGKGVLPGLFDNHTHIIRGGLNYNLELRWDGVRSLADAMAMLKAQVDITPAPQWVRYGTSIRRKTPANYSRNQRYCPRYASLYFAPL